MLDAYFSCDGPRFGGAAFVIPACPAEVGQHHYHSGEKVLSCRCAEAEQSAAEDQHGPDGYFHGALMKDDRGSDDSFY